MRNGSPAMLRSCCGKPPNRWRKRRSRVARDERQDYEGRMCCIVIDRLISRFGADCFPQSLTGILVTIVFRRGTRRDFDAQSVAFAELLAGIPRIDNKR